MPDVQAVQAVGCKCGDFQLLMDCNNIVESGGQWWVQGDDGLYLFQFTHCPFCGRELGVTG